MSEHCGYVVKVKELRPHNNADRLQIATFFGNDTIVGLGTKVDDVGVYFPVDLQLSIEFCAKNDLVRRKDENGNPAGGYLDPDKRNIRALKLRGEKSDGLFISISAFDYLYKDGAVNHLSVGDTVDILNGCEICRKYIPHGRHHQAPQNGCCARKPKVPIAPLFQEHADTEQLVYNMNAFKSSDQVEITLKMHGTSGRTAYLPKLVGYSRSIWDRITRKPGKPIYDWGYVTGTRRVVINDFEAEGGYYGDNKFREQHAKVFEGKLHKGESVYYEVVGFTDNGTPIMPPANNKKIQDKDFVKKYGDITTFAYGCAPNGEDNKPQSDMYVYRMTMTNEDGDVVEYTPDFMRYRCEQMGVKSVPVMWKGYIPNIANKEGLVQSEDFLTNDAGEFSEWIFKTPGEYIKDIAEQFYDGSDPIGKTHVREGVVIRIVNRPKFTAYKHKNFYFKYLSGIATELATENGTINEMDEDRLAEL